MTLLPKFSDDINRHLRVIKSLNEPIDLWDRILILTTSRKLNDISRGLWKHMRIVKYKRVPKFKGFPNLVSERCKTSKS